MEDANCWVLLAPKPGPTKEKIQNIGDKWLAQAFVCLSSINGDNAGAAHMCATADARSRAFTRVSSDGPPIAGFKLASGIRKVRAVPTTAEYRQHMPQTTANALE